MYRKVRKNEGVAIIWCPFHLSADLIATCPTTFQKYSMEGSLDMILTDSSYSSAVLSMY
jgi:hypothetical protein